ncbi:MAG: hypothetical protein ABI791_14285 [Acidobacteriota bacterium]
MLLLEYQLAVVLAAASFLSYTPTPVPAACGPSVLYSPQRIGPLPRRASDGRVVDITPPDSTNGGAVLINSRGDVAGTFTPMGAPSNDTHTFLFRNCGWTDIGSLGGDTILPVDLNNRGDIVGTSTLSDDFDRHAFLYSSGQLTDLGTINGPESFASAVNERGDVAGWSVWLSDDELHAFLFRKAKMLDLGTLLGTAAEGEFSFAYDINNRGDVVGSSTSETFYFHAFAYRNGEMIDLGTLGGAASGATLVNDRGEVVGNSLLAGNAIYHAFLVRDDKMIDLTPDVSENTIAVDLNERGNVVVRSATRSFVYSGGTLTEITAEGVSLAQAEAMNVKGEVVGSALFAGDSQVHAFLYSRGELIDLGTLAGGTSTAFDINDKGEVVGVSGARAFLFTRTPCRPE